jgi:GntR family transcriptional repressor for pyruvate dehydrogenase complex
MPSNSLKPKKLSDQVFEKIQNLILRGELLPGEQLKTERELCSIMEVSRPTLRAAIKKLIDRGLVEHRQGKGTFVASPEKSLDQNPLGAFIDKDETTLLDLLDVRLALECHAASLAAQRASGEDIDLLFTHNNEMRSKISQGELGLSEDLRFHMCLAYATKNPVQIHLMKNLYEFLHFGIEESLKALYRDPKHLQIILEQHEAVAEAIRLHDSQAAAEAMRKHISFLMDFSNEQLNLSKVGRSLTVRSGDDEEAPATDVAEP